MINALGNFFGTMFRWVYDFISSMGAEPGFISFYAISIIIMTILLKILMLPLFKKQNDEMKKMARLQPEINELQKKYKNDPALLNQKLSAFMKENKYNPMGGCLPMLLNFPIIMAFWRMMQSPEVFIFTDGIYNSIANNFFWIDNLKNPDPWILPLISAAATLLSTKLSQKNQVNPQVGEQAEQAKQMSQTMMMVFPVMIFFMGRSLASGLSLYWAMSNIFQVFQSMIMNRDVEEIREEALDEAEDKKYKKVDKKE